MKKSNRLLFTSISMLLGANAQAEQPTKEERPNVLLLMVDDLRPELGCYGKNKIISPNIDSLSELGCLFTRAYCNIPVSGASRASLLTGARPNRYRYLDYLAIAETENPTATPMSQWFRNFGYTSISNGKVFHNINDWKSSWDEIWRHVPMYSHRDYLSPENIAFCKRKQSGGAYESPEVSDNAYTDGITADKCIADLDKLANSGEPFFMACGFLKPHLPFNAPKKYWDLYNRDDIELPENYNLLNNSIPDIVFDAHYHSIELRVHNGIPKKGLLPEELAKTLIHGYRACVTYTDAQIGRVLDALHETGLDKNTIIVLISDHGWNLGEHGIWCKQSNFHTSMLSPMIIVDPRRSATQKTSDNIVEFIDIYPTLCDMMGIETPSHADGESLVPLLNGKKRKKNYAVSKFENGTTVIVDNYFYTEWRNKETGEFMGEMLYDHSTDMDENHNLAIDPTYKKLRKKMRKHLVEKRGFDYNE